MTRRRKPPTLWQRFRHLSGCVPVPRQPVGGWVWAARECAVCGRYPCGRWRLGQPVNERVDS